MRFIARQTTLACLLDRQTSALITEGRRNLLYVALTRVRAYRLITCCDVPSEFILDIK